MLSSLHLNIAMGRPQASFYQTGLREGEGKGEKRLVLAQVCFVKEVQLWSFANDFLFSATWEFPVEVKGS